MALKKSSYKHARAIKTGVIIGAVLVIIGSIVFYFVYASMHPKLTGPAPQHPTTETNPIDGTTAEDTANNQKSETPPVDQQNNTTSNQIPVATAGSIKITSLNQTNGYVNAKAVVSNFTTTQCVYSFYAPQAKPVVKQVNGDCAGVSIPQSEFEFIGTYTLTVTAYNGTSEKVSVSKDIAVQ